jgi:hypothetical protein
MVAVVSLFAVFYYLPTTFRNAYVGETNKLKGRANYNVWRLKMRALLIQEGLWDIINVITNPLLYLAIMSGFQIT